MSTEPVQGHLSLESSVETLPGARQGPGDVPFSTHPHTQMTPGPGVPGTPGLVLRGAHEAPTSPDQKAK